MLVERGRLGGVGGMWGICPGPQKSIVFGLKNFSVAMPI